MEKFLFLFLALVFQVFHVNGQLTFYLPSDKVSEGPCNTPSPTVASNLKSQWISQSRTYYVTYGNKAMQRRYAETFLNRPAKSVDELDTMCLQIVVNGKKFKTYAYGNLTLEQSCTSKTSGVLNCFVQNSSTGVNITAIETSTETVVYTDNATMMLIVRCINGQVRDYKVLSTTPSIGAKMISEVKRKVSEHGFSTLYSTKLNCDGKYSL